MQGCETGERADSPQTVEQGYTQPQRETPASGNLVFGKRQRFRKVHRFSFRGAQLRTRQNWPVWVRRSKTGAGWEAASSRGDCSFAPWARAGAPRSVAVARGGRRWLRSSTGGPAARKGKDRQIFQCFISLFLNEMSLS